MVKIKVVRKSVTFEPGFLGFVDDKVRSTFRKLSHQVGWVRIQVEDMNGPRGGLDKRCVVSVGGDRLQTVLVDVRDAEIHSAVGSALRTASRAVVRALERARDGSSGRRSSRELHEPRPMQEA